MKKINKERVAELLAGLAKFTASEEGVTRLAYSALDKEAQQWLLAQVADLARKFDSCKSKKTLKAA